MDERAQQLGEQKITRLLWQFSVPAIIGMLSNSLYMIINRLFVGNVVGADAISGMSVTMPISFVLMAFGMLVGIGGGALISIRLGQHKLEEAEHILGNALTLFFIIYVVISAGLLLSLDFLLKSFGASPAILPYGRQFISIILWGSIFQFISFGLGSTIRSEGNPRISMNIMLVNAGLNILLDFIFVYILKLGMPGTAVATIIAQAVSALMVIRHYLSPASVLKLRLKNLRIKRHLVTGIFAIGMAPFSMQLVASIINILFNQGLALYGGDNAIGAYGIIYTITMFILMPVLGINQGGQPIIGYNFGARNYERVRETLKQSIIWATVILAAGYILAEVFAESLMSAFSSNTELIQIGAHGIRIFLIFLPVAGFQIVSANFFQAIGKALISMILSMLRQVIVLIPLLLVLPRFLGLNGIWYAPAVADLISALITAGVLVYELRKLGIVKSRERIADNLLN
ncbi:MAG: MATE family efflux transporter [Syntrophomonadaceae bacterium]|nr:MATE family efflux transporter [Syntrophomonadaceae bacterium]